MPYIRISLMKGKSPTYINDLSDGIHQALVETFEVPLHDRFQIIHQLEKNELLFDRNYLCGPRSDDYLLIDITVGRARTIECKKAFYQRLVELLSTNIGIKIEDVMVVITHTQLEDWSFGKGLATMLEE